MPRVGEVASLARYSALNRPLHVSWKHPNTLGTRSIQPTGFSNLVYSPSQLFFLDSILILVILPPGPSGLPFLPLSILVALTLFLLNKEQSSVVYLE